MGILFSDTIASNIAPGAEYVDKKKLVKAVGIANIDEFIESLPLGFNTRIGSEGHGLSQGQKQRLLIARAVYKDPAYIFFDEATNALDANNEKVILQNLHQFFKGSTVCCCTPVKHGKKCRPDNSTRKGQDCGIRNSRGVDQKKGAILYPC
jgi:ATP-binding cassette, subfamily B, bacterial